MPTLKLDNFTGLYPRVPATRLPASAALAAANIDFGYGQLQSLRSGYKLRDLPLAAKSLYSQDGLRFYAWDEDVNCVESPMRAGEAHDRLYYTTANDFRVTLMSLATTAGGAPTVSFRAGVPRPTVAPSITVVHPAAVPIPVAEVNKEPPDTYSDRLAAAQKAMEESVKANTTLTTETRAYTYTYANTWNEEGPASPAATVEVKTQTYKGVSTSSTVTVEVTFDNVFEYAPVNSARVYRTTATGATTDYYFAFSAPIGNGAGKVVTEDKIPGAALNEVLSSLDAYPPDPLLTGLVNVGNGIMAAFKGRELWFSDAYRPWSWPPSYMKMAKDPIVGLLPYGSGVLATTVSEPSIFSGVSPDAMAELPIESPQGGVSKWSMLSIDGYAFYASNDGIVAVNGMQASLQLSQKFFTRQVWRDRYAAGLSTMQFAHYDGRILVFSKTGAFTAFMIELDEGKGEMTELPDFTAQTALTLTTSDQMYTIQGTALNQFGGGTDWPLLWRSGDIVLPDVVSLAIAEAECVGDFTIRFYEGGRLGFTKTVSTGNTVFRLPDRAKAEHAGLRRSSRWQFEIQGRGIFKWLKAASSAAEMKKE